MTLKKANSREVIYTSEHLQAALMSLKPLEETGEEFHCGIVQLFRFEGGKGFAQLMEMNLALIMVIKLLYLLVQSTMLKTQIPEMN